jgi:hypothetical protein
VGFVLKILLPGAHRHYFIHEPSASVSFTPSIKGGIVSQKISEELTTGKTAVLGIYLPVP